MKPHELPHPIMLHFAFMYYSKLKFLQFTQVDV